jgi:RNA ligase (TIGR02306 family)
MNIEEINKTADIRKLATVARITKIEPIDGAENIELAHVRGWNVVVKKSQFISGDLCVYVEVDSIMFDGLAPELAEKWKELQKKLSKAKTAEEKSDIMFDMNEISKQNTRPEFEFLRASKFRIKTKQIFGQISQGICFPLYILWLNDEHGSYWPASLEEGEDFTEALGITQYIPPDPASMGGDAKGMMQDVGLLISDEERGENLVDKWDQLRKFTYYKTEKCEGTSFTAYLKNGVFGVCGRTIEYKRPEDSFNQKENVYWKVARELDLENKMRSIKFGNLTDDNYKGIKNFALQGELIGESIQGNIYKLHGQTVKFYNIFFIDDKEYLRYDTFIYAIESLGLETVPILDVKYKLPENLEDLFKEVDEFKTTIGNSPDQLAEGFVFVANKDIPKTTRLLRAPFNRVSFKVKSRTYDINKNK